MPELPGTASVGIESVEWLDAGAGNMTVLITGRWYRRRGRFGADSAPPRPTLLVVESEGHRHRFPAMPEPPSLTGPAPGMWRLSFSVPATVAPQLGHTWLSLGTVTVPLPAPTGPGDDQPAGPPVVASTPLEPAAAVEPPVAEPLAAAEPVAEQAPEATPPTDAPALEIERAWRRAENAENASAQLGGRLAELEAELAEARRTHAEAQASLRERERGRRVAEQRAHAEEVMRRDLARQLAAGSRETARARQAMGELATAESRIRELERELRAARRAGDEAEQAAAAALAARERAQRALREHESAQRRHGEPPMVADAAGGEGPAADDERVRLAFENRLRARLGNGGARVPAEPVVTAPPRTAPSRSPAPVSGAAGPPPPVMAAVPAAATPAVSVPVTPPQAAAQPGESELVAALRRELDGRARAEAGLRARTVAAETRLAARVLLEQRTTQTLRELRSELERLGAAVQSERAGRRAAEGEAARLRAELGGQRERSQDASTAIGELRGVLEALRPPVTGPATAVGEGQDGPPVTGEREAGPPTALGSARTVDPAALSAALSRLRANAEPRDETPDGPDAGDPLEAPRSTAPDVPAVSPPGAVADTGSVAATGSVTPAATVTAVAGRPTVELAFRRLAARDADGAGRLLLGLLSCQHAAYPHPVAYDLVLGPGRGCVQVTGGSDRVEISLQGVARAREQVDFQVIGEPARIARLLTASPLRRLLRIGVARVRTRSGAGGRRDGLAAIRALLALPLDLGALQAAGLAQDGEMILRLVAAMIEPAWTRGESFTVAYLPAGAGDAGQVFLTVGDGRTPLVTRAVPAGRIATTITASPAALAGLLGGIGGGPSTVAGDRGPLDQLRAWTARARG